MKAEGFKETYTRIFWILIIVLLVILFLKSLNQHFNHDEFEAIHTSWKMLQGERIYIDFYQHHHPFFYYLLGVTIGVFGETTDSLLASRVLIFLMFIGLSIFTYLLAKKAFNREVGVISLLLLLSSGVFVEKALEIRPDIPQLLFGIISLYYFIRYLEKKNKTCLIMSFISLGVSFLFLQKAVFLIICIGFYQLFSVIRKKMPWQDFLIYWGGFVLLILPFVGLLVLYGRVSTYIMFNWLINIKFQNTFSPFRHMGALFTTRTIILWLFYMAGIFMVKKEHNRMIAFFSVLLFLSVFAVRSPYIQYYMPALSLIAIISAYGIFHILKKNLIILLVVLLIGTSLSFIGYAKSAFRKNNRIQFEKINYVLSLTDKEDFVYDGNSMFNLFRKDIDFFWFSVGPKRGLSTYQNLTEYEYDILELIDKHKPKVISNYAISRMNDRRIRDNYVRSSKYHDLYIRKEF